MENNLVLFEKYAKVPENAQKDIKGGRLKGMIDINPMWRIQCLTEEFGAVGKGWYYKITDKHIETLEDNIEAAAFVDIELYVKYDNEWSMPIVGTGGSSFVANERNGLYMSDECFKMALTDAISVACKALGFGNAIYWNKERTKNNTAKDKDIDLSSTPIEEVVMMKVEFGKKHNGETLKDIWASDKSYVQWLADSCNNPTIKAAANIMVSAKKEKHNG